MKLDYLDNFCMKQRRIAAAATIFSLLSFPASVMGAGKFQVGPCNSKEGPGPRPLTSSEEDIARKKRDWDKLIEKDKWSIRENCTVPYRWEMLVKDLAAAGRFADAASVLDQLNDYKIVLPGAVVARFDKKFLSSKEFLSSEFGKPFNLKQIASQKALETARKRLAAIPAKELPPNPFRRTGACPFECCQLGEWKARGSVAVYKSKDSKNEIGKLKAGEKVRAVEAEVILEPAAYVVTEARGELKAGDIIFFLDNIGEGAINYWFNGRENPEIEGVDTEALAYFVSESCQSNGQEECWLKKVFPEKQERYEWWVKIEMSSGKSGWVLAPGKFEGSDACG